VGSPMLPAGPIVQGIEQQLERPVRLRPLLHAETEEDHPQLGCAAENLPVCRTPVAS
jgi:hypothetical protein